MHKKYTYKGGKRFGPYYYETNRVNGKVVTTYLGSSYPVERKRTAPNFYLFLIGSLFLVSVLFLIFYNFNFTGNASLELNSNYIEGEVIGGSLKLILQEGELIPKDSLVIAKYNGVEKSFVLGDLIGDESANGKFYAKSFELSGEGEGYGLIGKRVSYPELSFELKVENVESSGNGGNAEDNIDNAEISETTGNNENAEGENVQAEEGNQAAENSQGEERGQQETGTSVQSETNMGNQPEANANTEVSESTTNSESSSEGGQEQSVASEGSVITGEVTSGDNENLVSGKVSKDSDFEYTLGEGESASLVAGSVKLDGEAVDDGSIEVKINNGKAIVTTKYNIEEEGFGEDYLGNEKKVIEINLEDFELIAENSSDLEVEIVSQGAAIVSVSDNVNVVNIENENTNITIKANDTLINSTLTNETIANITLVNETITNITQIGIINESQIGVNITQAKAIIGQPVKWEKRIDMGNVTKDSILKIEIPESADNVSVSYIKNEEDAQGEIKEKSLEGIARENETSIIGISITGEVSAEINTDKSNGLIDWFKHLFSSFGITGRVVGNEDVQEINVNVSSADESVIVEYYTDAPQATELENERGKTIVVTSPADVHYQDVLVFTNLSENLSVKDSSNVKIYWEENNSYVAPSLISDLDGNGLYDYIEWIAPRLSNQTFEIIVITNAEHLDENRTFISDIYSSVSALDGNWSETIYDQEYVRIRFERNLTNVNDITVYPRIVSGTPTIEVYEIDENITIARFDNLIDNTYNKVYLSDLNGSQSDFDLRILHGSLQFDYIVDPTPLLAAGTREGMLVYPNNDTRTVPQYRIWNGTAWSANYSANDVGAAVEQTIVRASPTRQEYVIATADGANDINVQINSTIGGTGCWNNGTACDTVLELTAGSIGSANRPRVAVGYEYGGGSDLVVAYAVNGQNNASYRIWDGSSWGVESQVPQNLLIGTNINYLRMASHPYTDEIALLMANSSTGTLSVIIWNGTEWGCEPTVVLPNIIAAASEILSDLVYEQNSGDLFIVTGLGESGTSEIDYTVKLNNSCTYTTTQTTNMLEAGEEINLKAQYGSDYVMTMNRDNAGNDLEAIVWNGTAMLALSGDEISGYPEDNSNQLLASTWAGTSDTGFAIYSDAATSLTLDYFSYNKTGNKWNNGTGENGLHTSGSGGITNFTDEEVNIVSYSFIDENKSWVFVRDDADDLWVKQWNGTGFQDADGGVAFDTNIRGPDSLPVIDFAWKLNYSAAGGGGDTTAPVVTIRVPANITYKSPLNFNVSLNENGSVVYTLNGGINNISMTGDQVLFGTEFNATNSSIAEGSYTFSVYANDTSGNNNWTASVVFTVDNTAPTVTIINPGNTTYTSLPVPFNISTNENSTANYTLNSGVLNYTMSVNLTGRGFNATNGSIANGVYTVRYYAWDIAGNLNSTANITFSVNVADADTTAPIVNLIAPPNNTRILTNISYFAANISDSVNITNATLYIWNSTTQIGTNTSNVGVVNAVVNLSFTLPRLGLYTWNYLSSDNSSNSAMNATNFTLLYALAPNVTALIPVSASTFSGNQTIQLAANVTDDDSVSAVLVNVTLPNGTASLYTLSIVGSGPKYNSSYLIPQLSGRYNLTFIANDSFNVINSSEQTYFLVYNITLTDCGTLDQADALYSLQNNVVSTGTCFNVTARNVTLDGKGYTIAYGNQSSTTLFAGINSTSQVYTTVQNVTIQSGNLATSAQNRYGVYFLSVVNGTIRDVNASVNRHGIYLEMTNMTNLDSITANNNSLDGFRIISGFNNTLKSITANNNADYGVFLDSGSNNTLTTVTANSNKFYGVHLDTSSNNTLTNITVNSNSNTGIFLYIRSNNNLLTNITANSNTLYGIHLERSSNNTFTNVTSNSNLNGVLLDSRSNNNSFINGFINDSRSNAVIASDSTGNQFTNITLTNTNSSSYDFSSTENANDTTFIDTPIGNYSLTGVGALYIFKDTGEGEIRFLRVINGSGVNLSNDIRIGNNSVFVNDTISAGSLNRSANVTLYNIKTNFARPYIARDGVACGDLCYNFTSLNAGTVVFNVTAWSNYSIGENNSAPITPTPNINATLGINRTLEDLNCFDTLEDIEADTINVSVRWFNNSVLHLSADYNNTYANGTVFNAVLDDGNTTKGQNWSCSLRLFDGTSYSSWINSSMNVTIRNTPPNVPTLSTPADHNVTTDRTPIFTWVAPSDDDSDSLTYQLNLTCYHSAGGGCSAYGSDDRLIIEIASTTHTLASDLLYLADNGYVYNWTVRAHDGDEVGSYNASLRRINISALIAVSLPNGSIAFGSLAYTAFNDTSDDSPLPFLIQNDGNSFLNVTIEASDLWRTVANPTANYQFKADNYTLENSSFNVALSVLSYTNVPAGGSPAICLARLNYTDATDSAEVDLNITVPSSNEGSGIRNSTVTFTASLGE